MPVNVRQATTTFLWVCQRNASFPSELHKKPGGLGAARNATRTIRDRKRTLIADFASYRALHNYLYDRVDQQLESAVVPLSIRRIAECIVAGSGTYCSVR